MKNKKSALGQESVIEIKSVIAALEMTDLSVIRARLRRTPAKYCTACSVQKQYDMTPRNTVSACVYYCV